MVSMMVRPQPTARTGGRVVANSAVSWSAPSKSAVAVSRLGGPTPPQKLSLSPPASTGSACDAKQCKELVAFLHGNSLLHQADLLLRNGFDDLETLAEMADADMKDLGLPGHDAVRLRKSIQQLRGEASQVDENHPVAAFLREIGLEQYIEALLQNGFDDMETLAEIQDGDMRDLGIARGHALKLAKRLREFQAGPAPAPPPAPPSAQCRSPAAPIQPARTRPSVVREKPLVAKGCLHGPQTTEAQSTAVERSWERVQHLGSDILGEKLYKHVFSVAPQTMELFPPEVRYKYREWSADEAGQEEGDLLQSPALRKLFAKVINAVGVSVAGLRQPGQMVPMLTQLGARHVSYGVDPGYWEVLGEGLILTLQECLGDDFTPEVQLAWTMVYGFISAVMIQGLKTALAAVRKSSGGEGQHSAVDDKCSVQSEPSTHVQTVTPLNSVGSVSHGVLRLDSEDTAAKSVPPESLLSSPASSLGAAQTDCSTAA